MDGEGSKSRDEIRIAKWVVGGVIPSMLTSWCPYCSISPLLSLILPLRRTPWKRSGQSRGGSPWRRADGAGAMRRGGEAGCCAHHRQGCAMEAADGAEEGDETGGDETGSCRLLCRVGSVKARASMRWRWAGRAKLQPM